MSKERLEEIKDKISLIKNSSKLQPHEFLIDVLHLDWLLEYVEESVDDVEELVDGVEELVDERNNLNNLYIETIRENWELEQDIKRYKQALEEVREIARRNALNSAACSDIEVILNRALEKSE